MKINPTTVSKLKNGTAPGDMMKNQYPPIIEKSLFYIEKTQERLGWLAVNVYRFPIVEGFGSFLEAVQRCLSRHGLFSWYLWSRDNAANQFLLVHIGRGQWAGHFEAESVTIIPRLWARYSTMPYMISDTIRIDENNKNNFEDWLARYLVAIGARQTAGPRIPMNWHQRSFGSAQIPQHLQKISAQSRKRTMRRS